MKDVDTRPVDRKSAWTHLPQAAAMVAAAAGAIVLFGWALDIPFMRNVLPGAVQMKVSTAITLMLAVTALAMKGDKERFLAAGCDGYIAKPYRAGDPLGAIDLALARSGAHRTVAEDRSPPRAQP